MSAPARRQQPAVAPSLVPSVDLAGLHRKLDLELDDLCERQCLLGDGLAVLHEAFMEGAGTHPRGAELNFMIKALQQISQGMKASADEISGAIEAIVPAAEGGA